MRPGEGDGPLRPGLWVLGPVWGRVGVLARSSSQLSPRPFLSQLGPLHTQPIFTSWRTQRADPSRDLALAALSGSPPGAPSGACRRGPGLPQEHKRFIIGPSSVHQPCCLHHRSRNRVPGIRLRDSHTNPTDRSRRQTQSHLSPRAK